MAISLNNRKLFFFWALISGTLFWAPAAHAAIIKPANNLGLVGYWNFDEGSSSVFADHSGQHNTATSTASSVAGIFGAAASFDGVQGEVGVLNPTFMNRLATNGFTVSVWIKPSSLFINESIFYNLNGGAGLYPRMQFGGVGGRSLILQLRTGGSTQTLTSNTQFSANTWYHVVVTFDSSNNFSAMYINGLLDNSTTFTAGALDGGSGNQIFKIGHDTNLASFFGGQMDSFRVYNRALSGVEAAALYNRTAGARFNSSAQSGANGSTLNQGLVARYTFDGADVTDKVYDRVGGNNGYFIGSATSTAKVQGKLGQALNFNGASNYVNLPSSSTFVPSTNSAITVAAWIKTPSISGIGLGNRFFSLTRNGGAGSAFVMGIGAGQAAAQVIDAGGTSYSIGSNTTVVANTWYHIVAVFNGSTLSIYVNGRLDNTPISGSLAAGDASVSGKIGSNFNAAANFFAGVIDDVRVYNRAISASEVKQLYGQGGGKINASGTTLQNGTTLANGLMGYWSFDGKNFGTTVQDTSGNGNNGYIFSAATSSVKAQGKLGQGINFNGTGQDVRIADASVLNPGASSFSVSAWVKEGTFIPSMAIAAKSNGGGANSSYGWHLASFSGNVLALHFATSGSFTTINNSTVLSTGKWYHVVAVVDRNNINNSVIYINGSSAGSSVSDGGNVGSVTNTVPLAIGSESDGDTPWSGQIDEVRVYNRALSQSEVTQLYNLGK